MKKTLIPFPALGLLAATLLLTACGREEPLPKIDNALLAYVPSGTPYVAANLERLPEPVADAYLRRIQPVIDELQSQLAAARLDLESGADGETATGRPRDRLALAVLRELDGNLSREGLASLGIDLLAERVVYGMGAFPVIRSGLADPDLLRATVQRILQNAGMASPEREFQGVSYWRLAPEDDEDVPVALYVAILSDHLAVGMLPVRAEADLLPAFLGIEQPAQSDAGRQLAELNRQRGYTPYGSGILDLKRLADEFLQPGSLTARVMADLGAYDPADITPECVDEVHAIIDNAPRMTAGTTELTANALAYQYQLESPPTLAARLVDLVARIPAAPTDSDRLMDFSFGLRTGAVRDFLREKAQAIVDDPFRCEQLLALNDRARQALEKLGQPMPPFVNNFRGLRVALDGVEFQKSGLPAGARGHLALHVDQPQMFLGMAQMFMPNLAELGLRVGEPPVRLPEDLYPVPGIVSYAAMTDEAIGVSLGAGEEATLPDWLDARPGPAGMFLSLDYDARAYLDLTDRFMGDFEDAYRAMSEGDGDGASGDERYGERHDGPDAVAQAAREAFRDMADRSRTTLQFGPDGLIIDGRMTFQPQP